jgi:hypothetical protein
MKGKGKNYENKIIDVRFKYILCGKRLNNFIYNSTFNLIKCLTCFIKYGIIFIDKKEKEDNT